MIVKGGISNGTRIISKAMIDFMIQNHLPNNKSTLDMNYIKLKDHELIKYNEGYGFGLGVQVKITENISEVNIGTHAWGGAMNTIYWIDPKNQLFAILMTQFCPPDITFQFSVDGLLVRKLVYEAIK